MTSTLDICRAGLWRNNPGLVQLLGLCPLLAVTTTLVNGLGLGIATTLTLLASNTLVSATRRWLPREVRLPAYVLIIASIVTTVELAMSAWFHGLYRVLGIFIPLIVTNCAILARAESFASRQPVRAAALDGLMMGLGFTAVLVTLGALRELLGGGTLLAGAHLLLGGPADAWVLRVADGYPGFLLAALPPGAFLGLALLLAGKNLLEGRRPRAAGVGAA